MNMQSFKQQFLRFWPVWTAAVICALLVAIGIALFSTPEYSSTIQIFVKQRYTLTDSYTATKSAESVSSNLAEVIRTSVFFDEVVANSTINFDELLSMNEMERRKAWKKKVETEVIVNTSQLRITAYDVDPTTANAIAQTVAQVLITQGSEWHSSPDTIQLKIVDTALSSRYPVRPNILLNALAAAVIGGALGFLTVFLRPSTPFTVMDHLRTLAEPISDPSPAQFTKTKAVNIPPRAVLHERQPAPYQVLTVSNFTQAVHRPLTPSSPTVKTIPHLSTTAAAPQGSEK